MQCVFLDYPSNFKGFWCLEIRWQSLYHKTSFWCSFSYPHLVSSKYLIQIIILCSSLRFIVLFLFLLNYLILERFKIWHNFPAPLYLHRLTLLFKIIIVICFLQIFKVMLMDNALPTFCKIIGNIFHHLLSSLIWLHLYDISLINLKCLIQYNLQFLTPHLSQKVLS